MAASLSPDRKNLVKRYLLWCYKTTKEEFDRIERTFTQLAVDEFVLKRLKKSSSLDKKYLKDFQRCIHQKKKRTFDQARYRYLTERLKALEDAARHFAGKSFLTNIKTAYEKEMTQRILTERGHR